MTRVKYVDAPWDVGRNDWNITRSLANSSMAFGAFTGFAAAMGKDNEVSRSVREAAILRVGALVGSEYEWRRHVKMARKAGLADAQIAGIKVGNFALLDSKQAMAARVAEAVETVTMTDALWKEASSLFSDSQLVEIVMFGAMYSLVSRFLIALDVDLDPDIAQLGTP